MEDDARRGRAAFADGRWARAVTLLAAASDVDDLERLAVAAHLCGRDDDSATAWTRAHHACVQRGDVDRAVRCAFWLGFGLMLRGEAARAGGWLGRAGRMAGATGSGRGYLLVPAFLDALGRADHARAGALAADVLDIAQVEADPDLLALGLLCRGEWSIAGGEIAAGLRLLDEAMVSVTAAEVSPVTTGIVYCAVIEACLDVFDLRRAAEWTDALDRWCAAQSDLVPYRGQCLVHRSQVMQARGAWAAAAAEAERACRLLADPPHPALGLALYQQGELHRVRGEGDAAERAYRAASAHGFAPVPGLALLRLAQGEHAAAVTAVRRAVEESRGGLRHPVVLAAAVDVLVEAGDVEAARAACDELAGLAARSDSPYLQAVGDHATGSVLLAEGGTSAAVVALRRACTAWQAHAMPFEAARARARLGLACHVLGDHDTAALELDAALAAFERLGAAPERARLRSLAGSYRPGPLTTRECEVLRLVATGRTNRQVAAALVISEHTVGRHLQNIFAKLDLGSRAAATAYAYEHGLVVRTHHR